MLDASRETGKQALEALAKRARRFEGDWQAGSPRINLKNSEILKFSAFKLFKFLNFLFFCLLLGDFKNSGAGSPLNSRCRPCLG